MTMASATDMGFKLLLLEALVVLSLMTGAVSQTTAGWSGGPPAFVTQCFPTIGAVRGSLSSNTSSVAEFCAVNGTFWNAVSSMQACMNLEVQTIPQSGFEDVNSALSSCNSVLSASISSNCASLSAKSENCIVSTSYFGQPATSFATTTPTYATNTADPVKSIDQQPSATSTQSPVADTGGSNIGLVAGVAVGAAIGALILAATAGFLIWQYRRRAVAAGRAKDSTSSSEDDVERAELRGSDDKAIPVYHHKSELGTEPGSERQELASPPGYARSVGGLQELDATKRTSCIKELASNEEVASEMATTEYGSTTDTLSHKG